MTLRILGVAGAAISMWKNFARRAMVMCEVSGVAGSGEYRRATIVGAVGMMAAAIATFQAVSAAREATEAYATEIHPFECAAKGNRFAPISPKQLDICVSVAGARILAVPLHSRRRRSLSM
jgi:hypothetical protein